MIRASIVALAIATIALVGYPAQSAPMSSETQPSTPSAESDNGAVDSQTAPTYSDAELKSFAAAVVEVHRINDQYIPKLQAASTPDEEQKLEAAALHEMVQAVEKEGISVEKYEEILTHAQTNRDIAHRLKQPLRDALSRVWT